MNIDISKVDEKGIIIDDTVSFGEEYIKNTPIQKLDNIKVNGRCYYSVTNEVVLEVNVKGIMVLLDAIDLEPIDYPFKAEIDEERKLINSILYNLQNLLNHTDDYLLLMTLYQNRLPH